MTIFWTLNIVYIRTNTCVCEEKYLSWKKKKIFEKLNEIGQIRQKVQRRSKNYLDDVETRIRKLIAPVSNGRNFRRLSTLVYTPRPVSKGPYSWPFYPRRNVLRFRMLSKRLLSSLQELALSLRFLGACLRFPFFRWILLSPLNTCHLTAN